MRQVFMIYNDNAFVSKVDRMAKMMKRSPVAVPSRSFRSACVRRRMAFLAISQPAVAVEFARLNPAQIDISTESFITNALERMENVIPPHSLLQTKKNHPIFKNWWHIVIGESH